MKSRENPIFGLFFSYFHSGTYFRTYLISYFGPKARNLFSSRPSESQLWTAIQDSLEVPEFRHSLRGSLRKGGYNNSLHVPLAVPTPTPTPPP